jgi:hypothetical protein
MGNPNCAKLKPKNMKTFQVVCLSLVTGFALLTACKKEEQETVPNSNQKDADYSFNKSIPVNEYNKGWIDDFPSSTALLQRWNLYGNPQPQWVASAFNRYGLFDNNGNLPNGSRAVSKIKIGNGNGYVIESEVYLNITNIEGTTICPEIGVTRYPGQPDAGISMKLMYIGEGVSGVPPANQNHTYIRTTALLQDGTIARSGDYALQAEIGSKGWHKMKIVVNAQKQVSFYLDGQFIWAPQQQIESSLMKDKNVLLGFTSPGIAGKVYNDWVKVSYPSSIDQSFALDHPEPIK